MMKYALILVALAALCPAIHADDPEWNASLSEGEFKRNRLSGMGSIMTRKKFTDFKFEAELTWDKANPAKASYGFYFGVPGEGSGRFYQVIINEKRGGPSIYVSDYGGPGNSKVLWEYSLPKPLAAMPRLKLMVIKKGPILVVGLGRKRALGKIKLDRPGPGHLRVLIVEAPMTCDKISVKEM